jgi:beta-lactamase superfamily II metal-dependent hydrolase
MVDYLKERDLTLEAILPSHPHFDHAGAFETILGSRSRHITSPMMIYRSSDPTWKSNQGWRKRFRDAVEKRKGESRKLPLGTPIGK